ncbi:MAG TPA: RNA-binding cell elongation regulator Jag/EloR [Acidimicrobiales bacterium]|nr:RNA-binding cell elongation regulator Jag/EloR [Acidimicrobiales bacterium]
MEWVEVTAKTVEEAKDEALDQLGVDESEAEFEVLEEPKAGLFGRLRSEARVRARVAPTEVRPKLERGSRRRGRKDRGDENGGGDAGSAPAPAAGEETGLAATASATPAAATSSAPRGGAGGGRAANGGSRPPRNDRRSKPATDKGDAMDDAQEPAEDAGEVGEEFLSGLISAFGVRGSVSRHVLDDGDTLELAVEGDDVGMLIGPRGATLAAIQELTRTVAQRKAGEGQPRIVVDVAGYRKDRREALERFTRDVAAQVVASGVVRVLEPMPPADRKVVHDTVNTIDGVSTSSEGEEPRRRVVIQPDAR